MSSPVLLRSFARSAISATSRSARPTAQRAAAFSTVGPRLQDGKKSKKPNDDHDTVPELPAFSLSHISSNPRTRFYIGLSIAVLALIETAAWVNFWPKITGWGNKGSDDSGSKE